MSEKKSNPAPLGLMGFGMTTILLNLHNAGFYTLDPMILAMGLAYGGVAQIIAGIMEFKNGNTFGTTAFTSYGLFWVSLVVLLILPQIGIWPLPPDHNVAMSAYFFMWGVFTFGMYLGTFKKNRTTQFVFGSLTLLFWLLSLSEFLPSAQLDFILGVEGILCGLSAVYLALGEVLNEVYGERVLPL